MFQILFGAAIGGAAMYYFDSHHGRRRRALLRDQTVRAQSNVRNLLDASKRDLANRAGAVTGRARSFLSRKSATDQVLVERVRSKMGRYVAHPGAVEVSASNGEVTLSGSILAHEHEDFVSAIEQVPGVQTVADRLNVYEAAEGISELQGGRARRGQRNESLQNTWTPSTRVAAGAAGTLLALSSLRGGFRGLLYGVGGALLLLRSATNKPLRTLAGMGEGAILDIDKTIQIDAPIERVYEFLANYENFPQFMRNVHSVHTKPDGRSHWVVAGPAGAPVEFESYMVEATPNETIAWESVEGSPVRTSGRIRVQSADEGTRVHIHLSYTPPAGVLGHAVAKLFGADPKTELDEDMIRLKSTLETGKAPRDAAAAQQTGSPATAS